MGSPSSPPLTVEESDGTNSNRPVTDLKFNAADFTIAASGRSSTVSLSGSGSGASLTDTYVGFGDASNLLTGSANFTFTEESGGNGPAVLLTGDKPVLKLQDDTDATTYRAEFLQSGASQYINIKDSTGTNNEMFRIDPTYIAMQRSMTAQVGIGTIPRSNVHLHVKGDATDAFLLLEGTDAGNNSAPDLVLYRNSISPADDDFVGIVDFKGNDGGGNEIHYGRIGCQIKDRTAGAHDGNIFFVPARDGSVSVVNNILKLSGEEGAVFNENGLDNFDFRIESDAYQNMFFIDSGLNKAFFGTGGIDNALGLVQINVGNSTQNALTVISTDGDAAQAPTIEFYRNSSSPASDDKLGQLNFTGKDLNGDKVVYAQMYAQIDNPAIGSHDGRLVIDVTSNAAAPINVFRADKDEIIINDVSFALDTRIETNGNENALFIDGSADTVNVLGDATTATVKFSSTSTHLNDQNNNYDLRVDGEYTDNLLRVDGSRSAIGILTQPDTDVSLHIKDNNSQDVLVRLETDENSADKSPALEFYKNSAADISDYIMAIDSFGLDDASNKSHYSRIATYIEDETAATENAVMIFQVAEAGTLRNNLILGSTLITVNQSERNVDFRILSDDGSINFYSDAGINAVGIQGQPTTGLADNNPALQVNGSVTNKMAIIEDNTTSVTPTSSQLSGQMFSLISASAITLTLPTSAAVGDHFSFVSTTSNVTVQTTGVVTLNGVAAPTTVNANTNYKIYKIFCNATDKWIIDVS